MQQAFYERPPPLGIGLAMEPVQGIGGFGESGKPYFWIGHRDRPPQTGVHVAFAASSREEADAFHAAAPAAGAIDNGGPGVCEIYHPNYYGAFVLDPDGKRRGGLSHAGLTPDGEQQLPGVSPTGSARLGAALRNRTSRIRITIEASGRPADAWCRPTMTGRD